MNKLISELSIRGKLSLIILAVSLLLLLLISTALITNERIKLKQNLRTDMFALAEIMGTNTGVSIVFDDDKTANDVLASLKAKANIEEAYVFTDNDERFASYIRPDFEPTQILEKLTEHRHYATFSQILPDEVFLFEEKHAEVFKIIELENRVIGTIYIQSDLEAFNERLYWYIVIMFSVMLVSLILALLLAIKLQSIITTPVYRLLSTIHRVSAEQDYRLRTEKTSNDEIGQLIDGFNGMLNNIEQRDQEIISLNEKLSKENQRMGAELNVTRKLQQMVLPTQQELQNIQGLDIAGFMEPADEVGGDYYDVLYRQGRVQIGIGDVTGHGLESGVVMLMVQMAVRTLLENDVTDPAIFIDVLNRAIFDNVQRMQSDKNLTLSLLDYADGKLRFSGQHEEVLIVRQGGKIERIDTLDLGFMVGLIPDIKEFIAHSEVKLAIGDGVVLYTDGLTEARNLKEEMYGVERLCEVISQAWEQTAQEVQESVVEHVREYISTQKVLDDITLLVVKRVA